MDTISNSIILVAGVSGAGKSTVLNLLEDNGFFCIENLPCFLLEKTLKHLIINDNYKGKVAISFSSYHLMSQSLSFINSLSKKPNIQIQKWYVTASMNCLLKRYDESRRKHPFSKHVKCLSDAIKTEIQTLEFYVQCSDYVIDTTRITVPNLRKIISNRLDHSNEDETTSTEVHIFSFGFKYGMPSKADYLFDVRNLPNPFWVDELRAYNGMDEQVINYLSGFEIVADMVADISSFLHKWCISHHDQARRYIEIGIGCTGGQHRSVYVAEQVKNKLYNSFPSIMISHSEVK